MICVIRALVIPFSLASCIIVNRLWVRAVLYSSARLKRSIIVCFFLGLICFFSCLSTSNNIGLKGMKIFWEKVRVETLAGSHFDAKRVFIDKSIVPFFCSKPPANEKSVEMTLSLSKGH